MKYRALLVIATSVGLISASAQADTFKTISTKAELIKAIDGRVFRDDNGWWELRPDGVMYGKRKGHELKGNWIWDKGAWCRNFTFKGKEKGTSCQKIRISGNKVEFTKKRGKGESSTSLLYPK